MSQVHLSQITWYGGEGSVFPQLSALSTSLMCTWYLRTCWSFHTLHFLPLSRRRQALSRGLPAELRRTPWFESSLVLSHNCRCKTRYLPNLGRHKELHESDYNLVLKGAKRLPIQGCGSQGMVSSPLQFVFFAWPSASCLRVFS